MRAHRLLALTFALLCAAPLLRVHAADLPQSQPSTVPVTLDTQNVGPRDMEELTAKSIQRSYAAAWAELSNALDRNQPSLLDAHFTGFARTNFATRIADQRKLGLHTRFVDRGHKTTAVLYPADGLSIQLRDEAQLEVQVFDGDKLLSAQAVTRHYIVVLTPAETSWKIRILQAVAE
jgi:hypothetical protein